MKNHGYFPEVTVVLIGDDVSVGTKYIFFAIAPEICGRF